MLTPSGNIHGMPVACLCGFGPKELIEIGGKVPAISPKWVRQIGIRSVDPGEKRLVHEAGLHPETYFDSSAAIRAASGTSSSGK